MKLRFKCVLTDKSLLLMSLARDFNWQMVAEISLLAWPLLGEQGFQSVRKTGLATATNRDPR